MLQDLQTDSHYVETADHMLVPVPDALPSVGV